MAGDEERYVGEVEADEEEHRAEVGDSLPIHAAEHLREPVVKCREEDNSGAAEHRVVEMRHDERCVVQVDVDRKRAEKQPRQPADGERDQEHQRPHHRGIELDRSLVERRQPVEDLDRAGHRDEEGQEREHDSRRIRHAAGEHVVSPDEGPDGGDRDRGAGDELVAEDRPSREGRNDLRDHSHSGQDHDVDRRVRVDPEQVLVEDRIASVRRVEDRHAEPALEHDQTQRDADDRRRDDLDPARRVQRPDEQRHPEPRHARRSHAVHRGDEVQSGEDRRPAEHEGREHRDVDIRARLPGIGHVERPPRIHSARKHGDDGQDPAEYEAVPGEQVDLGEDDVLRADHDRQEEVAEHRRNAGDDEQEDHRHAVQRQGAVVERLVQELLPREHELHAEQNRHQDGDEEEDHHPREIEDADPFVIRRDDPAHGALADLVEVGRGDGGGDTIRHALLSFSGVLRLRRRRSKIRKTSTRKPVPARTMRLICKT